MFASRGASLVGESEAFRRPGDGVEVPEAVSGYSQPSELVCWASVGGLVASAAAVAAAASSTVPV